MYQVTRDQFRQCRITMSELLTVLSQLSAHSVLKSLTLSQIIDFLSRVSLLKRDITLAQPTELPTDEAPDVLPPLIQTFLAESIGMDLNSIPDAWDILKGHAWVMTPLAEHVEMEKEAFRKFGWSRGLSESVIAIDMYPDCTENFCSILNTVSTY
jgi:hypothetical protein